MTNLSDVALTYAIGVLASLVILLPHINISLLAMWRVARLRNYDLQNYQEKINESIADTLKEQISDLVAPLFPQQGITLRRGLQPFDLVERLVEADPENLQSLAEIYQSLLNAGIQSEFFIKMVEFVLGG